MSFDMNDIRSQLTPSWTGVNIALVVVLFLLAWPLGLLMIAYIIWGSRLGLDFSRPETFSSAFGRVSAAVRAGLAAYQRGSTNDDAHPEAPPEDPVDFARWRSEEINRLNEQRRELEEERAKGPPAAGN